MKLKNILTSFAAAAAVLAGCTEKLPVELDVIKLDRSYVPLAKVVNEGEASKIEELDNVVNLTATVDWKIDSGTIPAGLEVSPTSGAAGAYKLTFTRAEKGKDDISGEIRIDAAGRAQFIKVFYPGDPALKPKFPEFEAGDYWIMFKHDTKWVALKGLELVIDDKSSYGYIYASDANVAADGSMTSTASAVYTFEACNGGFHIKASNGGYLYMDAKYNNFYQTANDSKADVWTVEQQTEETFMVTNENVSKFMQYTTSYSSAGAYAAVQNGGVLPFLVKAKDPAPEIIKLEKNTFSLGKEAGELIVAATINADAVKVVTTASWLHYQGNDAGALYFSYDSNNGGARTATVNITANLGASAADAKFTVKQEEGQGENPGGGKYVKVTSAPADWTGKYLIVFGDNAHATISGKDLKATAAVTVSDNAIASSSAVDAAAVTVAKNGSKYSVALPDGAYFGMAHNSCASSEEPYDVDFEYTADGIKISGAVSGKTDTYYLYNNNDSYFRCYVDKNGQTGYSLPVLYKYAE